MKPEDLIYPAVFFQGNVYFLEHANRITSSRFGGPVDYDVTGIKHGPRKLHHFLTLQGDSFEPLWNTPGVFVMQLPYAMCFGGGDMTYVHSYTGVTIEEMSQATSSEDWPYPDYPAMLPYFPLRLKERVESTLDEFTAPFALNLEASSSDAVVIVPPSPVLGMSLWGPSGDAEGVLVVFVVRMKAPLRVRAFNHLPS